jgi:hypothetical protein
MPLDLTYLPGLIPTIFCEYLVLVLAFGFYRYYCRPRFIKICHGAESLDNKISSLRTFRFVDTFESFTPTLKYVLTTTRLLSFGYIFGVSVIANYFFNGGNQWYYFSLWNVELLSIYYFMALMCSVMGLCNQPEVVKANGYHYEERNKLDTHVPRKFSVHIARLGRLTHILLEVCGGTASMITVVNFVFLKPQFSFWNVSTNFIPLISLLLELFLNNMYVRVDHFVYNISWVWLYLIFVWPLVALGGLSFWPYPFLAADSSTCFLMYSLIVVSDVISYFIFYGLSSLKYHSRYANTNGEAHERNLSIDTIPGIDNSNMEVFV